MKIAQIPKYLWSKHPYSTFAIAIIGMSALVVTIFFTLVSGLLIPAAIIGSIFIVGAIGAFLLHRSYKEEPTAATKFFSTIIATGDIETLPQTIPTVITQLISDYLPLKSKTEDSSDSEQKKADQHKNSNQKKPD